MDEVILGHKDYKPCFSGHETFPLKHGWLKKAHDLANTNEIHNADISIFAKNNAIALFGVGKNMVSAIKFWSYHFGLVTNRGFIDLTKYQVRTILAQNGLDPWMEDIRTTWFLHWYLIFSGKLTTYFWFFNFMNRLEFTKETLIKDINQVLEFYGYKPVAQMTLKRDIECFLKNYTHRNHIAKVKEDSLESPLTELNLIITDDQNDRYHLNKGVHSTLNQTLFSYALLYFWFTCFPSSRTMSLNTILNEIRSPGRIFCLSEEALIDHIEEFCKTFDMFTYSETAGMRQIILEDQDYFTDKDTENLFHQLFNNIWDN